MKRLAVLIALLAAAPAQAQKATPIPGPLSGPLPVFTGAPTVANKLFGPWNRVNTTLAPDGRSGSGLAPGNGGASPFPGPLGRDTTSASAFQQGTCASLAFDNSGRLLAVCVGPAQGSLRLIDPTTLDTISTFSLPSKNSADRTDMAGGTHFLVRADGSLLVPTHNGQILTVAVEPAALRQTGALNLAPLLASGEKVLAVGAGFDGRDWAVGNLGTVVAIPRDGGEPQALALKEPVFEDLATDPSGTFVVTRDALYRLRLTGAGKPRIVWRQPIPSGIADTKAGRFHAGPGTPPAIVARNYVAVADAVNPPRITVMRIFGRAARRLRCSVPVFKAGRASIEAHLVVAGKSIVATNQYGYETPSSTEGGKTTTGGIARVVVGKRGCRVAWTSEEISPSAQPVVSRATGLLYTAVKPPGFPDAWNLAAIDWRTGATRFAALAGEGLGYNSEGGAVVLGPDGSAYAGSFGGVTRFADAG